VSLAGVVCRRAGTLVEQGALEEEVGAEDQPKGEDEPEKHGLLLPASVMPPPGGRPGSHRSGSDNGWPAHSHNPSCGGPSGKHPVAHEAMACEKATSDSRTQRRAGWRDKELPFHAACEH